MKIKYIIMSIVTAMSMANYSNVYSGGEEEERFEQPDPDPFFDKITKTTTDGG